MEQKLKSLRNGPFKIINRPMRVTNDPLTQNGKTFHTHRNNFIPYYPEEPLLYPHIAIYNEQNFGIFLDCDTTDLTQNDLHTSYDNSETDDNVFDV